jgi:amino acid transporter
MAVSQQQRAQAGTLGTFTGVFTPSILTILGIILFLRLGYSVGNAGLRNGLVIIGIATAVSVLTSISLSAIATNIDVKGGGDYYMISRTLGVEFGGAIGVVLFLAQSVSIAFYAVGFGEAVAGLFGIDAQWFAQLVAALAVASLFLLAWQGADVASRFQFVVMGLLFAALVSFVVGAVPGFDAEVMRAGVDAPRGALGFWAVFAIFFPAVTGFTQGVSMSGDLKNPGKSLPQGTFAAVGVSTVVYVGFAVLLAGNAGSRELIDDPGVMESVAAVGALIVAGVIAATLSSAMASFLGAPRILQSLARDRVFPGLEFFAHGHGPLSNPRRAVLLSLGIALATVALGSLNAIAPVVSMFFLMSYGLLNYATYYEARAASPSFRPRFRYFHKHVSLVGALLCAAVMIAINIPASLGALLVLLAVHRFLRMTTRPERWADASRSHYFQRAREAIRAMTAEAENPRSWRPQILAFSADPQRRARLLVFASWLEAGSGLASAVEIVVGEGALKRKERRERQQALRDQIAGLDLKVYGRAVLAPDAADAVPVVAQSFGWGAVKPNTVLFGWPEADVESRLEGYLEVVRAIERLDMNVISMVSDGRRWDVLDATARKQRRIDVWWLDDDSSRLALLAAYLFTRTRPWSRATIRVLAAADSTDGALPTESELLAMLDEVRIPATVAAPAEMNQRGVIEASADSTFVFLPMRMARSGVVGPFGVELDLLLTGLPTSAAVLAGQAVDLRAGPETEEHMRLVEAEQQRDTARRRARALERRFADLEAEVESLRAWSGASRTDGRLAERVARGEARLITVQRRVLKAQARLAACEQELAEIVGEGSG